MSLVREPFGDARPGRPRPGRAQPLLIAIGVTYLTRLLVAWLASYPVVANVIASGIMSFEAGDGKLFEPGGSYLLEVLLRERAGLIALAAPTAVLLALGSLAGVVPEWMLLRALSARSLEGLVHEGPGRDSAERIAGGGGPAPAPFRALSRLGGLALASWAARGLLAFATGALAVTGRSFFTSANDERLALLATGVAMLFGLVGWACLSVLHDLAAIDVTLEGTSALAALERALAISRRAPLHLALRYAGWSLAAGAVLTAGAAAAASFDVSQGGSFPPLAALVVHQAAVLAQIGLHAAWLSNALEAATRHPDGRRTLGHAQADAFL